MAERNVDTAVIRRLITDWKLSQGVRMRLALPGQVGQRARFDAISWTNVLDRAHDWPSELTLSIATTSR